MAPWSAEEDRKLLLAMINLMNVNPDWEAIGAQVGRTGESVRQHFNKLKKEAAGSFDTSAASNTTPAQTGKKRKAPAKKTTNPTVAADDDDDDEDDDEGWLKIRTPSKKTKAKVEVKAEDED